jgi:CTP:molybdopterin cytidylyltransferase MocA
MASGFSRRFAPENKLLVPFRGKPLARHTLDLVLGMDCFTRVFFVAARDETAALARDGPERLRVIRNGHPERGQRESIRLGVEAASAGNGSSGGAASGGGLPCPGADPAADYRTCSITRLVISQVLRFFRLKPCKTASFNGNCSETEVSEQLYYMFFPCDQPFLDAAVVRCIVEARRPGVIVQPCYRGTPGNPALFSGAFREELLALGEGEHGRDIINRHPESLVRVEIAPPGALPFPAPSPLTDIDDPETLAAFEGGEGPDAPRL